MGKELIISIVAITLALVFYTIGVWWEHRQKELRKIHLLFFVLGLICDVDRNHIDVGHGEEQRGNRNADECSRYNRSNSHSADDASCSMGSSRSDQEQTERKAEFPEYDKAKKCLDELEPKRIPGVNKLAYYADLALVNVHLGEDEKAITIWIENKDKLLKFAENRDLGSAIASLNIFSMIYSGKEQDASREIESAKHKWTRPRDIREFEYMEGKIKKL